MCIKKNKSQGSLLNCTAPALAWNKGNKIIAMALKGTTDAVLPTVIKEENLKFYPWDPQRLKKLIAAETPKIFNR